MSDHDAAPPSTESSQAKRPTNQIPKIAKLLLAHNKFARDGGSALYIYHNGVYRPNGQVEIERAVCRMLATGDVSWTPQKGRDVAEFIRLGAAELMERPPLDKLNLKNGILDLKSMKLLPHTPDFLSTTQLPVNYDPKAKPAAWRDYTNVAFQADSREVPWEIAAWLMLPIVSIQKALLLIGGRGTGKSTFLRALRAFLGAENTSSSPLHYLEGNRFSTTRLIGKLANICPDIADTKMDTTNIFKAITGGDPITAEYKNGGIFDIYPYCRLVFSSNSLPASSDHTGAFTERWYVHHLSKKFENRAGATMALDSRLAAPEELSGVLNAALAALPKVLESGLSVTSSMESILETMRMGDNPAAEWVMEHLEEDEEGAFLGCRDIQEAAGPKVTSTSLGLLLSSLFPMSRVVQRKVLGVKKWVRYGVRWSNYHKNQQAN